MVQFFYWFFFSAFAFSKKETAIEGSKAVSIVVCGKNEGNHFVKLVPILFQQKYPDFEVVIVDDHSTDQTADVLNELATQYDNLSIVSKENVPDKPGKKAALYEGVKQAKNEWIVVTDADCKPVSNQWISHLATKMTENNNLILGISPNKKQAGLWKGLFRFETLFTAMLYISFAIRKFPYMGVGRNMALKRTVFLEKFVTILNGDIASGDDDLYVNFVAEPKTTAVCLHPESYTISDSPKSLQKWVKQKRRHLTAGFQYKVIHQILLVILPVAQWLLLATFIALLFTPLRWIAILLGSFQFLVQQFMHSKILQQMKETDFALEFPFYQLMWMVFQPYLTFTSLFQSKTKWN